MTELLVDLSFSAFGAPSSCEMCVVQLVGSNLLSEACKTERRQKDNTDTIVLLRLMHSVSFSDEEFDVNVHSLYLNTYPPIVKFLHTMQHIAMTITFKVCIIKLGLMTAINFVQLHLIVLTSQNWCHDFFFLLGMWLPLLITDWPTYYILASTKNHAETLEIVIHDFLSFHD